jgi:DnaJ-class molecular chaperone
MAKQVDCDVCERAMFTLKTKGVTWCDKCQGHGWWWPTNETKVRCDRCGGTGHMRCPKCLGSGKIYVPD